MTQNKTQKKVKTPLRRALNITTTVLTLVIAGFAIYVFVSVFVARTNNKPISIFGYSYYVVVTQSMTPFINQGAFVAVKLTSIENAKVDDVVVFYNRDNYADLDSDASIIHRVRSVGRDADGQIVLTTHGDANSATQTEKVTANGFIGILAGQSAFMGAIVSFASNPINWIFAIILIAALYVAVKMTLNIVRHYKAKEEKAREKELLQEVASEIGLLTDGTTREADDGVKPVADDDEDLVKENSIENQSNKDTPNQNG